MSLRRSRLASAISNFGFSAILTVVWEPRSTSAVSIARVHHHVPHNACVLKKWIIIRILKSSRPNADKWSSGIHSGTAHDNVNRNCGHVRGLEARENVGALSKEDAQVHIGCWVATLPDDPLRMTATGYVICARLSSSVELKRYLENLTFTSKVRVRTKTLAQRCRITLYCITVELYFLDTLLHCRQLYTNTTTFLC